MKTVLLEESVRVVALIGVVMFGVAPVAYTLGVDLRAIQFAFLAPFLLFPILVGVRIKTGRALRVATKRGWLILAVAGIVMEVLLVLLQGMSGLPSNRHVMAWIISGVLILATLVWLGIRLRSEE